MVINSIETSSVIKGISLDLSVYPFLQLRCLLFAYDDSHVWIGFKTDGQLVIEMKIESLDAVDSDDVLSVGTKELGRIQLRLYIVEGV